jgi:glycine oxidase
VVRTGAEVREVVLSGQEAVGVRLAGGETIAAEQVVLAAGSWSDGVEGIPAEARVPIHPVKGQIMRLHDPAGPGLVDRVLRMSVGYLVPRGDGRYVLGATVEERGFDTTVTAAAMFELLRSASEVVPGVLELVLDEFIAGLRPTTTDNAPAIGPGALPGLHWAVGHYRNGILLTPITAEIVLAGLGGAPAPAIAEPFTPARFAHGRSSTPPQVAAVHHSLEAAR